MSHMDQIKETKIQFSEIRQGAYMTCREDNQLTWNMTCPAAAPLLTNKLKESGLENRL